MKMNRWAFAALGAASLAGVAACSRPEAASSSSPEQRATSASRSGQERPAAVGTPAVQPPSASSRPSLLEITKNRAFRDYVFNLAINERCKPLGVDQTEKLRETLQLKIDVARRMMASANVPPEGKREMQEIVDIAQGLKPTSDELIELSYSVMPKEADAATLRSFCGNLPGLVDYELGRLRKALALPL